MISGEDAARRFVAERCDEAAVERLTRFVDMLRIESTAQNLVSASTLNSVWQRHVADSAQLIDHVPQGVQGSWLDIGTGAGFPGIVIAIMRPEYPVILVEPRARRVEWLERCCSALNLGNCHVDGRKLEVLDAFPASVISARAVAPLGKLLEIAAPFSTADTTWLLPKGRSAAQELASLPKAKRAMFHVEHSATDCEAGIIVGSGVEANRL